MSVIFSPSAPPSPSSPSAPRPVLFRAHPAPMPVSRTTPDRDPLSAALRPPIDETEEEKASRIAEEEAAKRVSHAIDEAIRLERQQRKKHKLVRLLLLGQSESGAHLLPDPSRHTHINPSPSREIHHSPP